MFGKKLASVLTLALLITTMFVSSAFAAEVVNLNVDYVEVNGHKVENNERIEVSRGETLDLEVKVSGPAEIAGQDNYVENVQIQALLVYQYSQYDGSVQDMTNTFDLQYGSTAVKDLSVKIPVRMDAEDDMLLHLTVYADNKAAYSLTYRLDITGIEEENAVLITEAYLSPSTVMAGRGTQATVKVRNYGDDALDDVTLIISIPGLNIQTVETLDELDADEKETFESMVLRIPCDAKPGVYDVVYTLKFDEYESTTFTDKVVVVESVDCGAASSQDETGKTMITVPESQSVAIGTTGVAYPVVIANMGNNAKSYQLSVSGIETWGTVRIDPASTVVVPAGKTQTVFLYVTANENAQPGDKVFKLIVNDGNEQKEIPLTASIVGKSNDWSGLKKVLEIGLIILVIILLIIGLIVGFNKLRGNDEDDDEDSKTYY
jgi:uncharacterized membrane protein